MTETLFVDPELEAADLWADHRPTELIELPGLARLAGVDRVFVKAEGQRPLGNFKALGGMVAGMRALARAASARALGSDGGGRDLPRLICASDGNHGLAVAAAAQRAGARASIYLPAGVSRARVQRIEALGADIVTVAGTYDDAVRAAADAAARGDGLLIPDTTADRGDPVVRDVMDGYAILAREVVRQLGEAAVRPSHQVVQAGVGGLAAAMAEGLREIMQGPRRLLVVEPEAAACVARALAAGRPVLVPGDLHTSAEMLSCGLASAPALEILLRHDARSVVVPEHALRDAVATLRAAGGPATTPSGAAGLAGLLQVAAQPALRAAHDLGPDSVVLLVATEGPVADPGA